MSTSIKPKEISQAQAKGHAKDLLAGLTGSDAWPDVLQAFEKLSAGNRKTVVEAMAHATGEAPKADPARLSEFAIAAIRVGGSTKPDFAVSLVQAVMDLCAYFGSTGATTSAGMLRALMSVGDKTKKGGLPDGAELDLARLAKSPAAASAVCEFLEDSRYESLLKATVPVWARLVAALVAAKGTASGIRPTAAQAVLKLMADPAIALPDDLVLCANWLCLIAGGVPEELARRAPFQYLLRPATAPADAGAKAREQAISEEPTTPRAKLLAEMEGLLKRFESEIEQRRVTLSGEVTRLTTQLSGKEHELENLRSEIFDLRRELEHALGERHALNEQLDSIAKERRAQDAETTKWKKEAAVLLDSRSNQIEQAKSDCRRDFIKAVATHFKSLRGFLLELQSPDRSASGSLAATALDEIIRVLHRQQFIGPEELPRLQ